MTKRCVFLSMDNPEGFTIDDDLVHEPLRRLGWEVETLSWRASGIDWSAYAMVIIRSPWDYQQAPEEFMRVLEEIDASGTELQNSLALVRSNLDKRYLQTLEQRGIPIVPTVWMEAGNDFSAIESWFQALATDELIIKPVISANADHTYRIPRFASSSERERCRAMLREVFHKRACMIQAFIPSVVNEGEFSLFYFAGVYSHAILKTPKAGDFRVQEEHGGFIRGVTPDAALLEASRAAMATLSETPLYARVDFVRIPKKNIGVETNSQKIPQEISQELSEDEETEIYAVMEFELIEPALYLRMDAGAPERFAHAVNAWHHQ